jgi:amidohydrolase
MTLKSKVASLRDELIALRRDFHMHPELGFEEHRTAEIVAAYLEKCGLEVKRMAKTGVVGLLNGSSPGRTLLIRADMDALPIQEQNADLPYCSVYEGKMHACGHDGHVAMLLVAAKILAEYREGLNGNIKFVFQPNEEDAGAYLMVEEGVLENPVVDAVAGAHLWSALETGTIDICEGPVMAASHYFFLKIKGRGGHAGHVSKAIDPISVSAAVIQAVQAMQTRQLDALEPVAIVFTGISAGCNPTTVPEISEMQGSIRFLAPDGAAVKEAFERVIAHICAAHQAEYELIFKVGNEMVSNDPSMVSFARLAALECLEQAKGLTAGHRSMGGEDFSEFTVQAPGVFYFIGSGSKEKKSDFQHHHPRFNIDEEALLIGTEMHVRVVLKYFGLT